MTNKLTSLFGTLAAVCTGAATQTTGKLQAALTALAVIFGAGHYAIADSGSGFMPSKRPVAQGSLKFYNVTRVDAGATNPETPFTVAIGGNIISRGVTFNNLLSMFFTRTVKHKIQQDTYIQRARMFGNRTGYLDHFELHIPETLYLDWHQAFALHGLSMASIETKNPVWLEDRRIRAVSSSSIDKSSLSIDRGEISFEKFEISQELLRLTSSSQKGYSHFQNIIKMLPVNYLSDHISRFVEQTRPFGDDSIVCHVSREIKGSEAIDENNISRAKGMFGGQDYERDKFEKAIHHFKLFTNSNGMARLIYNYRATDKSITFLKVRRKKI